MKKKFPDRLCPELQVLLQAKKYLTDASNYFFECDQHKENQIINQSLWKSAIVAYCSGIEKIEKGRHFDSCKKIYQSINELCEEIDQQININHFLKSYRNKAICHVGSIQRLSFKVEKTETGFKVSEHISISDSYDGRNELYCRYVKIIIEKVESEYNLCCERAAKQIGDLEFNNLENANLSVELITALKGQDPEKARICSFELFNPDYFRSNFYKKFIQNLNNH